MTVLSVGPEGNVDDRKRERDPREMTASFTGLHVGIVIAAVLYTRGSLVYLVEGFSPEKRTYLLYRTLLLRFREEFHRGFIQMA